MLVRRLIVTLSSAAFLVILPASLAFAQAEEPAPELEIADLASWLTDGDWARGGLLAVLGLVGALVTTFTLIGGAVPGTAGKAKIDADEARLQALSERLTKLIDADTPNAAVIEAVGKTVDKLSDNLRTERWQQFLFAAVLYSLLGAAFAALLAKDLLQALVFGAGWTGFIGSLGLKRDYAERKEIKDEALVLAMETAQQANTSQPNASNPAVAKAEAEVTTALAL